MQFTRRQIRHLLPLALLWAASGCAGRVKVSLVSPPVPDLLAVTEPKPVAPVEIVTSQRAADLYSSDVEAWGDRVSAAGSRICRWTVDAGAKLPFACPAPIDPNKP
jgi:hypothetical protein